MTTPIVAALSRCACSENMASLVSQPGGLSDPFDSGQSGKAIPALMLVVNAPRITRTKTQALPKAAKAARAGRWTAADRGWEEGSMKGKAAQKTPTGGFPQTL